VIVPASASIGDENVENTECGPDLPASVQYSNEGRKEGFKQVAHTPTQHASRL
jgi:hypothetical protein